MWMEKCSSFLYSKTTCAAVSLWRSRFHASSLLEFVHTDVCVPVEVPSESGVRYFVMCINDYSKLVIVYPIPQNLDVKESFLHFEKMAQLQTGRLIRAFHSNRGREIISTDLENHFEASVTSHELTTPYSPIKSVYLSV